MGYGDRFVVLCHVGLRPLSDEFEGPRFLFMQGLEMKDFLAIWGALLSTLLAANTMWQTWKRRSRLEATYSFAADPDVGNEIIIQNPSDTPAMVSYWELFWAHRT